MFLVSHIFHDFMFLLARFFETSFVVSSGGLLIICLSYFGNLSAVTVNKVCYCHACYRSTTWQLLVERLSRTSSAVR